MRQICLFLGFCLLHSLAVIGQHDSIEELTYSFQTASEDTAKINRLISLREAYLNAQAHELIPELVDSIVDFSTRIGYDRGIAFGNYYKSQVLREQGLIEEAIGHDYKALDYFINNHMYYEEILVYNSLATLYFMLVDNDSSLHYLKRALGVSQQQGLENFYYIGANIGIFYNRQGLYDSALTYLNEAIVISEREGFDRRLPLMYSNVARAYEETGLDELHKANRLKCYEVCVRLGDKRNLGYGYYQKGIVHQLDDEFDSALYWYNGSIELYKEVFPARIPGVLNRIGQCYLAMGQFDLAIQKCVALFEQLNAYEYPKTEAYILYTSIINELEPGSDTLESFTSSLTDAPEAFLLAGIDEAHREQNISLLRNLYMLLTEYYEKIGDIRQAYIFLEKGKHFDDSVFNAEQSARMLELQTNYQLKSNEHSLREYMERLTGIQNREQVWIRASIVLLLVLIGAAYYAYRLRVSIDKHNQNSIQDEEAKPSTSDLLHQPLVLKSNRVVHMVDIIFIRSEANDVIYRLKNNKEIKERETIKHLLDVLPEKLFCQIHRSIIININEIKELNKSSVLTSDNQLLRVSKTYSDYFHKKCEEAFILMAD